MTEFDRITLDPAIMGGRPRVRGTVGLIVGQIASGRDSRQILEDYPYLSAEDIAQALRYAAWRAEEREVTLAAE